MSESSDSSRASLSCMPKHYDMRSLYYVPPEPQHSIFFNLPAEIRNIIYRFTYGDTGVMASVEDNLARPEIFIMLDKADPEAGTDEGELVKFRSAHRITGLYDTCRQIRQETEDFNPLWKMITGTSGALLRLFDQPHPFEYSRVVTISLSAEDALNDQGCFDLSEDFKCLMCYLVCFRYLKQVKVFGCAPFSIIEQESIFTKITELLSMGTWIGQDFQINCYLFEPAS